MNPSRVSIVQRFILPLVVTFFIVGRVFAALSPEAFTQEYVTQLRAALPAGKVEVTGPLKVHVADGKGHEQTVFLDNAFGVASSDPDSRQTIIGKFVASTVQDMRDVATVDTKNIVPVVKDSAWIRDLTKTLEAQGGKAPPPQWNEPLNDDLMILYAEDTPNNMRFLSRADLEKAGVNVGEVRALAVANLRRKLPDIQLHTGELFSMLTADGNYESSLLLFDNLWSGEKFKVDGDIVVAVPSRDVLAFTGSRNAAGLKKLREIADQISAEGSYTLTNALFVFRNGKFTRFE